MVKPVLYYTYTLKHKEQEMSKYKRMAIEVVELSATGLPLDEVADRFDLTLDEVEIILKTFAEDHPITNMFGTPV